MFSLDLPTEPYWLDLPFGVRVQVKPLTALVQQAAINAAIAVSRKMLMERAERILLSVPADDLPDLEDEVLRTTIVEVETARGLGRYGIIAWEGIGDGQQPEGPLPYSPDAAERIATHPDLIKAFTAAYYAPLARLAAEGNGSPPMPNGSTAPGGTTAETAPEPAQTAPDRQALH